MTRKILFTLVLIIFSGCLSQQERYMKNREKAKQTITILSNQYGLSQRSDTIIRTADTIEKERIITRLDTFWTQLSRVDTVFSNKEGIYSFDDLIHTISGKVTVKQDGVQVTVTKVPERIILVDTILVKDTIITERVITKTLEVIKTEPSIFWSIWGTIKNYIWLVLIVICSLLVYKIIK